MARIYKSGIPGLDEVMRGGFLTGRSVMIEGYSGTGKTVLGMALIHAGIAQFDERGVIVSFEQLPESLYEDALSLGWDFRALERQGKLRVIFISPATLVQEISAQISSIGELIAESDSRRLFIDGINMLETVERDSFQRRELINQVIAAFHREGLNVFFSRERPEQAALGAAAESYIADTVIQLTNVKEHKRRIRYLEVLKSRGQEALNGLHSFKIDEGGVTVYPRQKTPAIQPLPVGYGEERATFGVAALDEMLGGGLFKRSATIIAGSSGTGKTILALQFLIEGARSGEPGLFISMEEPAEQILANARTIARDADELLRRQALAILAMSPLETHIDEQIVHVREAVAGGRVERLAFDSLSTYEGLLSDVEYKDYVYALLSFIKSSGVTAVLTSEIRELTAVERITSYGTSYLLDNIIMLRFVELANTLRRAIVVLKTRGSDHANDIREYAITKEGIQIVPIDPAIAVPVLSMQQYSHVMTAYPEPPRPAPGSGPRAKGRRPGTGGFQRR